jgi:hypothetical protein
MPAMQSSPGACEGLDSNTQSINILSGRKDDGYGGVNAKLPLDLLPMRALQEVAKVLAFGAAKYEANNWQKVKPRRRYFAAALRHLWARALGEKIDAESKLPHLAHAACDVLFLLSIEVGLDDPDAFEESSAPKHPDTNCPICEHDMCLCRPFKEGDLVRVTVTGDHRLGKEGVVEKVDGHPTRQQLRLKFDDEKIVSWFLPNEVTLIKAAP